MAYFRHNLKMFYDSYSSKIETFTDDFENESSNALSTSETMNYGNGDTVNH